MSIKNHSRFWYLLNSILRQFIVRGGVNVLYKSYTINEYPKSGGSWLGQMLASSLELPFPRNQLPIMGDSIMHGHYLKSWNMDNVIVLWRDGRDVLISEYYHSLFPNEKGNHRLVSITRSEFKADDYEDIQANLPNFIDYIYKRRSIPRFTWVDFVDNWENANAVYASYEVIRKNPADELKRIVEELACIKLTNIQAENIADQFSFEKQSGRKPGIEQKSSFMRKGVVGDWKNQFTAEAKERFDFYAGDALIKLGYESDHDWVKCD